MLYDRNNILATNQAFSATGVATDAKKLPRVGGDIAVGPDGIAVRFIPRTNALVVGTETYEFQIVTSTAADGVTGQVVIVTTGTISTARAATLLVIGNPIDLILPPGLIPASATHYTARFVGANTPGITLDIITGPVSSFDEWKAYPAAVNVVA